MVSGGPDLGLLLCSPKHVVVYSLRLDRGKREVVQKLESTWKGA